MKTTKMKNKLIFRPVKLWLFVKKFVKKISKIFKDLKSKDLKMSNTMPINLNDSKATFKMDNYFISLSFLLVIILLLIITICYYCKNIGQN